MDFDPVYTAPGEKSHRPEVGQWSSWEELDQGGDENAKRYHYPRQGEPNNIASGDTTRRANPPPSRTISQKIKSSPIATNRMVWALAPGRGAAATRDTENFYPVLRLKPQFQFDQDALDDKRRLVPTGEDAFQRAPRHQAEVFLPIDYPRRQPLCRMTTPVFHPNIDPQKICIGDHWSAGQSLAQLVVRISEMISYQSYNVKSPLNARAAAWAEQHMDELPLEQKDYSAGL